MRESFRSLLLSCEHASRRVPRSVEADFAGCESLLASHRGWDAGALEIARVLRRATGAPLLAGRWSRLIVDLNRPENSRSLFSEISAAWSSDTRERWLEAIHRPHWGAVERAVDELDPPVLHLAVHTFTPVWNGEDRGVDVGLLYDPSRERETQLAHAWVLALREACPELRVRRNRPYRGNAPGLTTSLRTRRSPSVYLGLELEVRADLARDARRRRVLVQRLAELAGRHPHPPTRVDHPTHQ